MKVWNYIIIFVGLSLLLWMAGINISGVGELLVKVGFINDSGAKEINSNISETILAILAGAAAVGIAIGILTKAKTENYIILPFVLATGVSFGVATFINLSYSLITYAFTQASWIGYITLMIFGPLAIGFIVSIIEFFRGTD